MKQSAALPLPHLSEELEARLLAFDTAWQQKGEPVLLDHIQSEDCKEYVLELIQIDHERRLCSSRQLDSQGYQQVLASPWNNSEFIALIEARLSGQRLPHTLELHSQYEGMRPHGSGGLGHVYETMDQSLERPVALKVLQEKWCQSEIARGDFLQEARVTSQLEHPGIVPVYQVGTTPDGRPCYSMRLIAGQTFREAITAYHQIPAFQRPERRQALRRLVTQLASVSRTIAFAHNKGVLHQDIKPENIMLGEFGEAFVLDWGFAKTSSMEKEELIAGSPISKKGESGSSVRGTLGYLSPEQATGDTGQVTVATDIFALGSILYTLLCNRPPYQEASRMANISRAVLADYDKPSAFITVPRSLEAICLKAMAKQPGDRYASATALADDLDCYLADDPVSAWKEPWGIRVSHTIQRHRTLASTLAALFLVTILAVAIGSWLLTQEKTKSLLSEQKAELQEQSAQQITTFLARLFDTPDPLALPNTSFHADEELNQQQAAFSFLKRGKELVAEHLEGQPLARAKLLYAMSRTYHALGSYDSAKALAEESYLLWKRESGPDHADTVAAQQLPGQIAQDTGEYEKARAIYQDVLSIRRQRLGTNHLLVAETLFSLGSMTFFQPYGDRLPQFEADSLKEAEKLLLESLRIRKQHYKTTHPDIGQTLAALASLKLTDPGQEQQAIAYALEAGQHFKDAGSGSSLGTLLLKMIAADEYRKKRKFAEAEKIYIEVMASLKKHLGSKHPITILHMANYVGLLNASQDLDRALRMAYELLEVIRPLAYFRSQPIVVQQMIYFSDVETNRGARAAGIAGYQEAMKFALERPTSNQKNLEQLQQRFRNHGLPLPAR